MTMAFRNTMKTAVLLAAIGGLLVLVGSALGGSGGAVIGLMLGLLVVGGSYWFSDRIAVRAAGAREVSPAEALDVSMIHSVAGLLAGGDGRGGRGVA